MRDFELRPYKIAAELDSMFNEKRLTGIGKLEFLGANQMILTDEYAGLCVMYQVIHGEEDKKKMPNPMDEEEFIENFDAIFPIWQTYFNRNIRKPAENSSINGMYSVGCCNSKNFLGSALGTIQLH